MDLLEKGKQLAKSAQFEDALDALLLALENDKENPDIHFFIGLCYSSLQQFSYAKYHYDLALVFDPKHEKTFLMASGLKGVTPEKPPHRSQLRSAEAKERLSQEISQEDADSTVSIDSSALSGQSKGDKLNITGHEWEQAFPTDKMTVDETGIPLWLTLLLFFAFLAVVGFIIYTFVTA